MAMETLSTAAECSSNHSVITQVCSYIIREQVPASACTVLPPCIIVTPKATTQGVQGLQVPKQNLARRGGFPPGCPEWLGFYGDTKEKLDHYNSELFSEPLFRTTLRD